MNTDGHGCPQADEVGEQQLPSIGQQLKKNNYWPWMICEPNEKEGRKLMAEIMQGGNFGQLFKWRMKNEETSFGGRRESQWRMGLRVRRKTYEAWTLEVEASDETCEELSRGGSVGAGV